MVATADRRALLRNDRHARRFRHDLAVLVVEDHIIKALPRHSGRLEQPQAPALPRRKIAPTAIAQPRTAQTVIPRPDRCQLKQRQL
jgi:hypothetical protein